MPSASLLLLHTDRALLCLPAEQVRAIHCPEDWRGGAPLPVPGLSPRCTSDLRVIVCEADGVALPLLCPRPDGLTVVERADIMPLPLELLSPQLCGVVFGSAAGDLLVLSVDWLAAAARADHEIDDALRRLCSPPPEYTRS